MSVDCGAGAATADRLYTPTASRARDYYRRKVDEGKNLPGRYGNAALKLLKLPIHGYVEQPPVKRANCRIMNTTVGVNPSRRSNWTPLNTGNDTS